MVHETGPLYSASRRELASTRLMLCRPVPGQESPFWAWYQRTIDAVARPGTTVDFVALREGYKDSTTPYTIFYNALGQAERAYEAEKKGYMSQEEYERL